MNNYDVLRFIRQKMDSGYGTITYLGAEQRFVSAMPNSGVDNLEEQFLLGVSTYTETYETNDATVIEKSFCASPMIAARRGGYYKIISTIPKVVDKSFEILGEHRTLEGKGDLRITMISRDIPDSPFYAYGEYESTSGRSGMIRLAVASTDGTTTEFAPTATFENGNLTIGTGEVGGSIEEDIYVEGSYFTIAKKELSFKEDGFIDVISTGEDSNATLQILNTEKLTLEENSDIIDLVLNDPVVEEIEPDVPMDDATVIREDKLYFVKDSTETLLFTKVTKVKNKDNVEVMIEEIS